jgi:hypothetical protein
MIYSALVSLIMDITPTNGCAQPLTGLSFGTIRFAMYSRDKKD